MKSLTDCRSANEISFNIKRTELVNFKHKKEKVECPIRIKLRKKRLYLSNKIKYLKKAIRIINNQPRNSHSSLLFKKKKNSILDFEDLHLQRINYLSL